MCVLFFKTSRLPFRHVIVADNFDEYREGEGYRKEPPLPVRHKRHADDLQVQTPKRQQFWYIE